MKVGNYPILIEMIEGDFKGKKGFWMDTIIADGELKALIILNSGETIYDVIYANSYRDSNHTYFKVVANSYPLNIKKDK
tara:strand:+ start:24781 stop:25017 length:237 start_codon:yes stop_codon:yes gene_type:complete